LYECALHCGARKAIFFWTKTKKNWSTTFENGMPKGVLEDIEWWVSKAKGVNMYE